MIMVITDTNQIPDNNDYKTAQESDTRIKQIIKDIYEGTESSKIFVIRNDILYRLINGKMVIELPEKLIDNILYIHHDNELSGHHAIDRTLKRIQERFYLDEVSR